MVETTTRAEGMRAYPQGELFLTTRGRSQPSNAINK